MTATARLSQTNLQPIQHSARFYASNTARIQGIANYLAEGLDRQEGVLLICSVENRDLVFKAVGRIFSNEDWDKIHYLDADEALAHVLIDGVISGPAFQKHIHSRVRSLIQKHGRVRVYGDIVDELAADGNDNAVLDLEDEWHRALERTTFQLHCGYLMENFRSFKSTALFEKICRLHTNVDNPPPLPEPEPEVEIEKSRMVALGELSAMVSHELNNPLTLILFSIANMRDWAQAQTLDSDRQRSIENHIASVERAAQRMVSINRDVLSFSRGSSEHSTSFSLKTAISHNIENLAARSHEENVELKIKVAEGFDPRVFGNEVGIGQVILNLASNSMDSIREKKQKNPNTKFDGLITVELERVSESSARIIVRDNGVGFSKQKQIRMFEAFFTTKPVGFGTGLGLTFSQKTLQQHGGTISCDSVEGESASFTITLPTHS